MSIIPSKPFLARRKEILTYFDSAKDKAYVHIVQTYHGCFVEEKIREWLKFFLPKKYDVCSGYVISQELKSKTKQPHFDIIIYDALNSPVLWVEELSQNSKEARAIPAEYVLAVFEVKSVLTTTSINNAIAHINELSLIASKFDTPEERYKKYLTPNFFWGMIFIEIDPETSSSATVSQSIIEKSLIRNYYSTLILRKQRQNIDDVESGRLNLIMSKQPMANFGSIANTGMFSNPNNNVNGEYLSVLSVWSLMEFISFQFDVLALLNGTYKNGMLSSFYGMELFEGN